MNIVKKIYCRVFQTGLRIALPFLPYRKPRILKSVDDIPGVLLKKKLDTVLIVTDPGISGLGLTLHLQDVLTEAGINYILYDETAANPTTDNVDETMALYLENGCKAIIGFGGGSSMDCAKATGAKIAKPKQPLSKMEGILKVHKKIPPLFAIPTTAGTGSEATLAAVIVDSETRHKYAINDFPLIPRYAVLDPKVTTSLPPFITATTGMDALTHAVEAYIGRSTTPGTRADALIATELIFKNLDTAYYNGEDLQARKQMLHAAYYAGCSFTKSYVGYVHAIAHSVGGQYNVPHGLANAIILPMLLEAYGPAIHEKLKRLAIAADVATEDTDAETAAEAFIQAIKDMKRRYGIGDTIPEIVKDDIPKLAKYADKEANPLYPVPVLMNAGELAHFYEQLLEEEEE